MATVLIALGGNLGDPRTTQRRALQLLNAHVEIRVTNVSRGFVTAPVGADAGEPFVNSAAQLETTLAPEPLLDVLQSIETQLGRVRTIHWGPRSLDLDLIGYDELVMQSPRLTLPHVAMWYRRFVLDPLCDIAPEWRHPLLQESVSQLRARLQQRPLPVHCDSSIPAREDFLREVSAAFPVGELVWAADQGRAAITFVSAKTEQGHRNILLAAASSVDFAVQILRAALDVPAAVAE